MTAHKGLLALLEIRIFAPFLSIESVRNFSVQRCYRGWILFSLWDTFGISVFTLYLLNHDNKKQINFKGFPFPESFRNKWRGIPQSYCHLRNLTQTELKVFYKSSLLSFPNSFFKISLLQKYLLSNEIDFLSYLNSLLCKTKHSDTHKTVIISQTWSFLEDGKISVCLLWCLAGTQKYWKKKHMFIGNHSNIRHAGLLLSAVRNPRAYNLLT